MYFLAVLLFAAFVGAQAQSEQDKIQEFRDEQAQYTKSQALALMDTAVALMDSGNYKLADAKFVVVLKQLKSVPSDLAFYFGKNSYYLGKYKQCQDWLNKYIELKGTTGRFYNEALQISARAQADYLNEQQKQANVAEQILSSNYDIDCGPTGMVICPVCKGSTVIIRKGPFGDEYRPCPYCHQKGVLTCEEYNLLIKGELTPGQ